jgi:hypothetical protein
MADVFDDAARDVPKTAPVAMAKTGDIFDQAAKEATAKPSAATAEQETIPQRFARHVVAGVKNIPNMMEQTAAAPAVAYEMYKKFTGQPNDLKEMPARAVQTFALAPEGEAGEAVAGEQAAKPPTESGVAARVGKVIARHIPGVKLTEDLVDAIKGPVPEPPAVPVPKVPDTGGVPWGSGGQGPLDLRGKMIPRQIPQIPKPTAQTAEAVPVSRPAAIRVIPKESPNIGEGPMQFRSGESALNHYGNVLSKDDMVTLAEKRGIPRDEIDKLLSEGKTVKGTGEAGHLTAVDVRNNVKTEVPTSKLWNRIVDTYSADELDQVQDRANKLHPSRIEGPTLGKGAKAAQAVVKSHFFPELVSR